MADAEQLSNVVQFPADPPPPSPKRKRERKAALTDAAVKAAKPKDTRYEIADGHTRVLYLIVQPSGMKSCALRYRFNRQPRKHTLGPYPALKLKDARNAALEALRTVNKLGKDPAAVK